MGQSLMKRDRITTAEALSPIVMLTLLLVLLPNECSGKPIETTDPSPPPSPAPVHIAEIAGMLADYEEGQSYRDLGIVINEYEYDESSAIPNSMRLGSAPLEAYSSSSSSSSSDRGRRIVRQSVCHDVKMEVEDDEGLEIVSRKVCTQIVYCDSLYCPSFSLSSLPLNSFDN